MNGRFPPNLRHGIPVDANTWKELTAAARQAGMPASAIPPS